MKRELLCWERKSARFDLRTLTGRAQAGHFSHASCGAKATRNMFETTRRTETDVCRLRSCSPLQTGHREFRCVALFYCTSSPFMVERR
ncbi:hypothetical protein IQ06DRAFT_133529 [Phaeosphaeriaceae sp. SRC1lsM3a]|nr:hypothetical protein IQ06DRAFT_133529 [Stagonospora sp. SRC1lsM3a]